jgi:WD40 repeat protein
LLALSLALALAGSAPAQEVHELSGHLNGVRSVAFSPDGKHLASFALDSTVRIWDVATRVQQRVFSSGYSSTPSVVYSPDGRMLLSSSGSWVRVWNPDTGAQLRFFNRHGSNVHMMAFSPDGRTVASAAADRYVRLWNPETTLETRAILADDVFGGPHAVAYSLDGKLLATGGQDRSVRVWDPASGKLLQRLTGHTDAVVSLAFSRDGRMLVSASHDRTIRLWEVSTGKERLQLSGHTSYVRTVALSADGRTLASGGYDNAARLWDPLTGKELKKLDHRGTVWSVAFAPGDKVLASGCEDRSVRLWKVSDWTGRAAAAGGTLSAKQQAALWTALASDDAGRAYRAMGEMGSNAEAGIGLLKDRLKPVQELDGEARKRVGELLADLDAKEVATRRKAIDGLVAYGAPAGPQVRAALARATDVDVKLRLFVVLRGLQGDSSTTAGLRTLRALETLERIGNAEALALVKALAKGVPDAPLTKEARASLARMTRRGGGKS